MRIYISHASNPDVETGLYAAIRQTDISSAHEFFLPHTPEHIDTSATEELERTDLPVNISEAVGML